MVTKAPDKPSWGADGETAVEIPTSQSQQRLKAIAKPELRWDEDAKTALVPIGAIIPAEAYRNAEPGPASVTSRQLAADAVPTVNAPLPAPSSTSQAGSPTSGVEKPRRTRWLLPGLAVLLAFATTYLGMSMVREMRAGPSGAATPSVWGTFVKVLGDVRAKVK